MGIFWIQQADECAQLRTEKQQIAQLTDRFDRRKQEAIEARTTAMAELGAEINELKGI